MKLNNLLKDIIMSLLCAVKVAPPRLELVTYRTRNANESATAS